MNLKRFTPQLGSTLLEGVIAIGLLSYSVAGLIGLQSMMFYQGQQSLQRLELLLAARNFTGIVSMLEPEQQKCFTNFSVSISSSNSVANSNIGGTFNNRGACSQLLGLAEDWMQQFEAWPYNTLINVSGRNNNFIELRLERSVSNQLVIVIETLPVHSTF